MRSSAYGRALVDAERVTLYDGEAIRKFLPELGECRHAAAIPLDGDHRRPCFQQSPGQPTRAGADLIDPLPIQIAGDGGNPREQLPVEDEILGERLACGQPVAGDDVSERFGHDWVRRLALSAAMRMAAAIGLGSARSWPAMSNAVPWSGAVRTIGSPSVTLTASSK